MFTEAFETFLRCMRETILPGFFYCDCDWIITTAYTIHFVICLPQATHLRKEIDIAFCSTPNIYILPAD